MTRLAGKLLLSCMILAEGAFVGALVRFGYECRAAADPMMGILGAAGLLVIAAIGARAVADLWKPEVREP